MKNGDKLTFILESADNPPTLDDNLGFAIAFVPLVGFQSCRYHNGSKSWQSCVTLKTVIVEGWLKKIDNLK